MAEIGAPRPLVESDDRMEFDCGRASLNEWLQRRAWNNHAAGISRVNVVCDGRRIVGYVTLSAAQIERSSLPKSRRRNKPEVLPATLLGQLAVHKTRQGRGIARSLMLFALRTAFGASRNVASWGIILHPLDDELRNFYARFGFQDLPFDPSRAMVVRMVDLERSIRDSL